MRTRGAVTRGRQTLWAQECVAAQREILERHIRECGSATAAAQCLGIKDRSNMRRLMRAVGIEPLPQGRPAR